MHKPKAGLYDESKPLGCLDFASLYPNVIISHNLCPTTVSTRAAFLELGFAENVDFRSIPAKRLEDGQIVADVVTEKTYAVLLPNSREGQCPEVARHGLELRNVYKAQKKEALALGKHREAAQHEALELAVKASNNSLYGITIQPHCPIFNSDMANLNTQISRDLNLNMTHF